MLQKKKKIAKLYIIYNFEICTDSSGINFSGSSLAIGSESESSNER